MQEHISNFDGDAAHKPWTVLEYDSHECQDDDQSIPDVNAHAEEIFGNIYLQNLKKQIMKIVWKELK